MAKSKPNKPKNHSPRIANRRAFHDYHIGDKFEVGIVLKGSEVKSIRNGQVSLAEGFAMVELATMELWLHNVEISPYTHAGPEHQHTPKRQRKLLARKREIRQIADKTNDRGVTLVPLAMFFVRGKVKLEIGIGTGKKSFDKRQDMKKRDADREMRRSMSKRM
jgi:SsrA-binding protein